MGVAEFRIAAARLAGADATLCVTNDRRWAGKVDRPAALVLEEWAG